MKKDKSEKVYGYSVRLGKKVEMVDCETIIMKNNMKAIRGKSKENGDVIFRIIGKATPEEIKANKSKGEKNGKAKK